jgi:hypothetical protein
MGSSHRQPEKGGAKVFLGLTRGMEGSKASTVIDDLGLIAGPVRRQPAAVRECVSGPCRIHEVAGRGSWRFSWGAQSGDRCKARDAAKAVGLHLPVETRDMGPSLVYILWSTTAC